MARAATDRLQQLKDEIAAGTYLPDSRAVAEKMLERWYRLYGGGARQRSVADAADRLPSPASDARDTPERD